METLITIFLTLLGAFVVYIVGIYILVKGFKFNELATLLWPLWIIMIPLFLWEDYRDKKASLKK